MLDVIPITQPTASKHRMELKHRLVNEPDLLTVKRSYASAVLGVVILSVCHTHSLWLIQRTYWRYFYTTWKGNPSSFLPPNICWWATSLST